MYERAMMGSRTLKFGKLSATFWKVARRPSASERVGSASVSIDEVQHDDG